MELPFRSCEANKSLTFCLLYHKQVIAMDSRKLRTDHFYLCDILRCDIG